MADGDGASAGTQPPLSSYGFLSDCRSAALVSRDGSVDWWCVPRFDSPSVFGRLLDPEAGHWLVTPERPVAEPERAWAGEGLVVRTRFAADSGVADLVDALAFEPGSRGHEIGLRSPGTLLRRLTGVSGRVRFRVEVVPRLEYGLTRPRWRRDGDRWVARAGPARLVLAGDVAGLDLDDRGLCGSVEVAEGEVLELRLGWSPAYDGEPHGTPPDPPGDLADTLEGWASWQGQHGAYDGEFPELVRRSAAVLQGLTYQPSGAIAAAATTSLPEALGGSANFDYRFAWVRDVSLTLQALWVAACPDEADRYFRVIAEAMGRLGDDPMQIVFGLEGERDLSERELPHLRGYRGSAPVRVGNAAWRQRQLDVLGEVLAAAEQLAEQLGALDPELQEFLAHVADEAARTWREPDAGMWEARDRERHYVSSKVMCWVALDRAVRLADSLGDHARPDAWARARDEVRAEVLERAWDEGAGAYTGAFGSDHLDASVLLMPVVGFLPADDERMLATVHAVRDRLAGGDGLVRRWAGEPNAFVICSFWLVECLALAGEVDEARALFRRVAATGNELGLFAEMVDPATGEALGNLPQAFSHVGLVNAAWRVTCAARERSGG